MLNLPLTQSLSYYQGKFMVAEAYYKAKCLSLEDLRLCAAQFLISLVDNKKHNHSNFLSLKEFALNYFA